MPSRQLGSLIDGALKRMGLHDRCQQQRAILLWPEVVGETNARRSWPEGVRDGVLSVATASSAWAQELSLLKPQILQRLREHVGAEVITDIRFRASRRQRARPGNRDRRPGRGASGPALTEVAVDRQTSTAIESMAAEVGDPELRESLHKAMLKMARLRAWRLRHGWRQCQRCGGLHRSKGTTCPVCHGETRWHGWQRLRLLMRGKR